jgi:transcriptional regulator with XRE-family HTH domain
VDALQVFAGNMRRLRTEAGLTQEALADRSGVDFASVGRIERAERDPGVRTVARLAAGLGVEPVQLFVDVPASPSKADSTTKDA